MILSCLEIIRLHVVCDFHYRGPNRYCHMKELCENTINNNNNNDIQHLKGIFINYINTCNTNNKAICSC